MKLLLYCTKARPNLLRIGKNPRFLLATDNVDAKEYHDDAKYLNGKIVAECDFEVEEIKLTPFLSDKETYINEKELLKNSCLSYRELADYIGGKGYAIHIKNLNIFDEPRELYDYFQYANKELGKAYYSIKNAPQNMMYAYDYKEKYILISIRPEWLCKILNGDKTIEVRKKVLKEMITDVC